MRESWPQIDYLVARPQCVCICAGRQKMLKSESNFITWTHNRTLTQSMWKCIFPFYIRIVSRRMNIGFFSKRNMATTDIVHRFHTVNSVYTHIGNTKHLAEIYRFRSANWQLALFHSLRITHISSLHAPHALTHTQSQALAWNWHTYFLFAYTYFVVYTFRCLLHYIYVLHRKMIMFVTHTTCPLCNHVNRRYS